MFGFKKAEAAPQTDTINEGIATKLTSPEYNTGRNVDGFSFPLHFFFIINFS